MIKYNAAFLRPPIPPLITGPVTKAKTEKVKYVDDGLVAVSIDLKKCLIDDPQPRPRHLAYDERNQQILPSENNILQYGLDDTEEFTNQNEMKIERKKIKGYFFR